jgi:hypothetical protein
MNYETWPSNEIQICPYDCKEIPLKKSKEKIKGTRMQIGKGNKKCDNISHLPCKFNLIIESRNIQ